MAVLTFICLVIFALSIQFVNIDLYALARFIVYKIQVFPEFDQELIINGRHDCGSYGPVFGLIDLAVIDRLVPCHALRGFGLLDREYSAWHYACFASVRLNGIILCPIDTVLCIYIRRCERERILFISIDMLGKELIAFICHRRIMSEIYTGKLITRPLIGLFHSLEYPLSGRLLSIQCARVCIRIYIVIPKCILSAKHLPVSVFTGSVGLSERWQFPNCRPVNSLAFVYASIDKEYSGILFVIRSIKLYQCFRERLVEVILKIALWRCPFLCVVIPDIRMYSIGYPLF